MEAGDAIVFVDCCCHGSAKRTRTRVGATFHSLPLRVNLEPLRRGYTPSDELGEPTGARTSAGISQDHGTREHADVRMWN